MGYYNRATRLTARYLRNYMFEDATVLGVEFEAYDSVDELRADWYDEVSLEFEFYNENEISPIDPYDIDWDMIYKTKGWLNRPRVLHSNLAKAE